MHNQKAELKDIIHTLFKDGKVNVVIGYENGSLPLTTRPCFITTDDARDKITLNSFCTNNLATYVPAIVNRMLRKNRGNGNPVAGIIAKGCDARSIAGLIRENQVSPENICVIGIPCTGMADRNKINTFFKDDSIVSCSEDGSGVLTIKTKSGRSLEVKKEDVMLEACRECSHPAPVYSDILIKGEAKKSPPSRHERVREFEQKTRKERWEYFTNEISRCIRCYACRQACPNCYCKVCFADQTKPGWIGAGDNQTDIILYHIGRIFHQAGRCVGCDACVRVCPMGIDLRLFTGKVVKDVEDLFGFVPGISREADPPLCTFNQDDTQEFTTEPCTGGGYE